MTNVNNTASSSKDSSQQHTSGSTTSQSNSFGGSVSVGVTGEIPTAGASGNFEHSSSYTKENSDTNSKSNDKEKQLSEAASMSIKDWGSYAFLDTNQLKPQWVFAQEFP